MIKIFFAMADLFFEFEKIMIYNVRAEIAEIKHVLHERISLQGRSGKSTPVL